jgi:trimethylamine--corrinoid protein Co-methyltransferase
MLERLKEFNNEELSRVHQASVEILRDVGVRFNDPEAIRIFKQHGIKTDGSTVFLTEKDIQKALETVPHQFTITARNPEKSVTIGGGDLVHIPGYGSPFVVTNTGEQREATLEDYQNFCKLVQTSEFINMNGYMMVEPMDISPEIAHLDMLYSNLVLCDKPFMGSPVSQEAILDSIEMAGIVWGGKDQIKNKSVMIATTIALSPLQYAGEMAKAIIEFAKYGQPVMLLSLIMAGSTGPVRLPGVIVLQNAEILAGLALAQLVNPGTPVAYGTTSSVTDMRTGLLSMGAPELSMILSATAQMAKFYKIPSRGTGGVTDAHVPDIQAGIESTLPLTVGILSGIDFFLHSCGILGSYISMSYEKFVADEELCGMLTRILKPTEISDETIDLKTIKEIGIGGEYLTHSTTYEHCRKELFIPTLMNRHDYEMWKNSGKKWLHETAAELVTRRLESYEKPEIDPELEQDLLKYINKKK